MSFLDNDNLIVIRKNICKIDRSMLSSYVIELDDKEVNEVAPPVLYSLQKMKFSIFSVQTFVSKHAKSQPVLWEFTYLWINALRCP